MNAEPAARISPHGNLAFLKNVIDALSAHIAILDEHGTIVMVNESWRQFALMNHMQCSDAGVGCNYLHVCDSAIGDEASLARIVAHGIRNVLGCKRDTFMLEYPCHNAERPLWFQLNVTRFVACDSIYMIVVHENITEWKLAEQRLQESEKRFRLMIERSSDAIVMLDAQGIVRYVSPSIESLLGYRPQDRLGHYCTEIIHPDDRIQAEQQFQGCIQTPPGSCVRAQYRMLHCDGSWRWIEINATNYLHDRDIQAIIASYRDITPRVQREQELRVEKDKLEAILHSVADGIMVQDESGYLLYANKAAADVLDYDSVEALMHDSWQEILGRFEMVDEKGQVLGTGSLPGCRVLAGEAEASAIIHSTSKLTGEQHWATVQSRPVTNAKDEILFAITIIHDLTEQKEAERRKDEFIAMASHELKTPLTSLKIFMGVLQRRFRKNGEDQYLEYLGKIEAQINTLTELINDMLDVSRIQIGKLLLRKETFELSRLMQETIDNLRGTQTTHSIRYESSVEVQVFADRYRIGQVLINLLTNAVKYSPAGSEVIVRLCADQKYAVVSVQDFGIGIDEVDQQRIFERFYQVTGPVEKTFPGLGIGLYISNEIIKCHQGRMWVESRKGEGSTFSFALPLQG